VVWGIEAYKELPSLGPSERAHKVGKDLPGVVATGSRCVWGVGPAPSPDSKAISYKRPLYWKASNFVKGCSDFADCVRGGPPIYGVTTQVTAASNRSDLHDSPSSGSKVDAGGDQLAGQH